MKELIDKIKALRSPADPMIVDALIGALGDRYSIPVLETVLQHYKDIEKQILSKDLLEWMQEHDQTAFETDDAKVSIRTFVSASVLDPDAAFRWLEEREYGDLIKDTLEFPKGEFSEEARQALAALQLSYTQKRGIHPQSLKKVMSDRLKAGEDLPWSDDDDIGDGIKVGYYDEVVIKEK